MTFCRGRARVICINDAYRLAPWGDVLYAADSKWWHTHRGVTSFVGLKYSLQPESARWPGVQILENTGETGLDVSPTGLRTGRNSGYQSMNLAVHLGASRIVLLGYDMQALKGQANSHWFGEHPPNIRADSPYDTFIARFETIVQPLAALGIDVINSTRETALTVFPRRPLAEALAGCEVCA